jgi:hypothetical protein
MKLNLSSTGAVFFLAFLALFTGSSATSPFATQSLGQGDRHFGAIAAVLAGAFVFILGTAIVLGIRHNKKLCWAPPKAQPDTQSPPNPDQEPVKIELAPF